MKYTPILGEALAEDIVGEKNVLKNLMKININRFGDDYMKEF